MQIVSSGVFVAALAGSIGLVRTVVAGDQLLQPLLEKYGKLTDYEWYTNDEARIVFHGPGPMGTNSWPIYYAGFLTLLLIGAAIAGAVGLSTLDSSRLRMGVRTLAMSVTFMLGWLWVRFGESIAAISSVVE